MIPHGQAYLINIRNGKRIQLKMIKMMTSQKEIIRVEEVTMEMRKVMVKAEKVIMVIKDLITEIRGSINFFREEQFVVSFSTY